LVFPFFNITLLFSEINRQKYVFFVEKECHLNPLGLGNAYFGKTGKKVAARGGEYSRSKLLFSVWQHSAEGKKASGGLLGGRLADGNAGFHEHLTGEIIPVPTLEKDFLDPGIDDHLCADHARLVCAVERCALDADAVKSSLDDGILFGV
jgi:hypothetical protein